jgi:hypothetical protein
MEPQALQGKELPTSRRTAGLLCDIAFGMLCGLFARLTGPANSSCDLRVPSEGTSAQPKMEPLPSNHRLLSLDDKSAKR